MNTYSVESVVHAAWCHFLHSEHTSSILPRSLGLLLGIREVLGLFELNNQHNKIRSIQSEIVLIIIL